jgi:hypothetical protein
MRQTVKYRRRFFEVFGCQTSECVKDLTIVPIRQKHDVILSASTQLKNLAIDASTTLLLCDPASHEHLHHQVIRASGRTNA